jgi:hypothetical protein
MHTPDGGGGAFDMPAAYNAYNSARIFIPSLPCVRRPWGLLLDPRVRVLAAGSIR